MKLLEGKIIGIIFWIHVLSLVFWDLFQKIEFSCSIILDIMTQKKSVLLQGFWWPAMSHVLNSSMLLMTSSITSEIIYYYTASWLCRILEYSNSWKISVGLLRKIFLLLLIYWLISSISWRCRSGILRRRLLVLCSVRISVSVATGAW